MPREIVHWSVLTRTIEQLKQRGTAPAVVTCLESQEAAAFLGAMTNDAPYYYKFGGDPFELAARFLHGEERNDTVLPIRIAMDVVAREVSKEKQDHYWAFFLGMLSHSIVDWNFHPMIFYFTGNYDEPDPQLRKEVRLRHRLFETYLDSWFRKDKQFWNGYSISASLRQLGPRMKGICRILDQVMVPEVFEYQRDSEDTEVISKLKVRSVEGRWSASIQYLSVLQTAFLSPGLGFLAAFLVKVSGARLKQFEVLFSRGRLQPIERFAQPLQYKNPVSGETLNLTVDELLEQTSIECADAFEAFEAVLLGSSDSPSALLSGIKGKSLNFGYVGVTTKEAKYYSQNGIEMPGLETG